MIIIIIIMIINIINITMNIYLLRKLWKVTGSSSYRDDHTFTTSAIGVQFVAITTSTSETARWHRTITDAIRGWACCSTAAWSTFIYICKQQTSASVTQHLGH